MGQQDRLGDFAHAFARIHAQTLNAAERLGFVQPLRVHQYPFRAIDQLSRFKLVLEVKDFLVQLTLFIVTVAACEAAIALALILMLYRRGKSLDVSLWQELREPDLGPIVDEEPLPQPAPAEPAPHLPPAGLEPAHRTHETSHV